MAEQEKEFDSMEIPEERAFADYPVDQDTEASCEPAEETELKFACPCCGRPGFTHEPNGSWDICEVCGWEDDPVQLRDPDFAGGANELSLNQAKALYAEKNAGEGQI